MRYALIGCGRIAPNHMKAALEGKLELTAVCDLLPEKAESLLRDFRLEGDRSIRRYTDYKAMLSENRVDLAAIATESGSHAEIALWCIDHGIHVIVEKPIALSMADADEIVRRSAEKGVTVTVCHQNRFNRAVEETRRALDAGRFGRLSHGAVCVRWYRDLAYYSQADWRGTWAQDGGCLMNQCIHGIDLLIWLMGGDVTEVYGATRRRFHDYMDAEDVGQAILKFRSGAIATVEGTTNTYRRDLEETVTILGRTGTVKLGGISATAIDVWDFADVREGDEEIRAISEDTLNVYGNGHTRIYEDMLSAISSGRRPSVTAVDGRNALEVILAIYQSQRDGIPVKLPLKAFATTDMVGHFRDRQPF